MYYLALKFKKRIMYRRREFSFGPVEFLIITNVILFILVSTRPQFIDFLGMSRLSIAHYPWTIITSMFVHAPFPDFTHILFNMITLYFFGTFLLGLVGDFKFYLVYFGGGIVGNLLFLLLANPFSIAIGASGAIFALGGALAVMRPSLRVFVFPIPVPIPLWTAVLGGFLLVGFIPSVAWQAHLGGIAFGALLGFIFRKREPLQFRYR
jgi:uncharacterized protein